MNAQQGLLLLLKKQLNILGIELLTSKGPIIILTNYSPPRRHFIPIGEIENILQKKISLYTLQAILTQTFLP